MDKVTTAILVLGLSIVTLSLILFALDQLASACLSNLIQSCTRFLPDGRGGAVAESVEVPAWKFGLLPPLRYEVPVITLSIILGAPPVAWILALVGALGISAAMIHKAANRDFDISFYRVRSYAGVIMVFLSMATAHSWLMNQKPR